MSLLTFNDASTMNSTVSFAEETMVNVKGKGVKAIAIPVVGSLEDVKKNFSDTLKTAKITLTDSNDPNVVNSYEGYTNLVSIAYIYGDEDTFKVTLSLSTDIEAFVNSVSDTIEDLKESAKNTSEAITKHDETLNTVRKNIESTANNLTAVSESLNNFTETNDAKIESIEKSINDAKKNILTTSEALNEFNTITVPAVNKKIESVEKSVKEITEEPDIDNMTLDEAKTYTINKSKVILEDYLAANPITSSCHGGEAKKYAITSEKQQYLSMMILMTSMAAEKEISYTPSWNATGESCTYDWKLEELQQLAIEIETVVRPLISKQQHYEKDIKDCTSIDEIKAITISY